MASTEQELIDQIKALAVTAKITPSTTLDTQSKILKKQLHELRNPKPVVVPPTAEEIAKRARITSLQTKLETQDLSLSELNELKRVGL